MGESTIWFLELPYNSIYIWEKLRDVFLTTYYPVSKYHNHIYRVNNFVTLPGESFCISWDRFTSFVKSLPNHRLDDELLKEYLYRGHDHNNNVLLDTIAGGSNGESIMQRLQKS